MNLLNGNKKQHFKDYFSVACNQSWMQDAGGEVRHGGIFGRDQQLTSR